MIKKVIAKLRLMGRKRLSGSGTTATHDDNVLFMSLKVVGGPEAWLDRSVTLEVGVSELVDNMPAEVAARLRDALNERYSS